MTEDQIRALIWDAYAIRQRDPRAAGCRAPSCRCVEPCEALALPELTAADLDTLHADVLEQLRDSPMYAFAVEFLAAS